MADITLELSWPPSQLSPNKRLHWSKVAKAKKSYRHSCYVETLELLKQPRNQAALSDGNLVLELTFIRPDRRSYDRDNLIARMKAGIDGACDALGIDDKRFATVIANVDPSQVAKPGLVILKITGE